MNTLRSLAALTLLAPLAAGCASRTAPFDELDKAPMTILRLGPPPAPPVAMAPPGMPGIPGVPPELQQMGQQILQGVQQTLPGLLPPGLMPGAAPPAAAPPQPTWKGYTIVSSMQLTDEDMREDILDIFGDEDSFEQMADQNCFQPGLGISISGAGQPPVDLLVSFQCNQARGDGFRWPYPKNGFSDDARQELSKIYSQLFGPIPPGA